LCLCRECLKFADAPERFCLRMAAHGALNLRLPDARFTFGRDADPDMTPLLLVHLFSIQFIEAAF
ncbi:MAG: hypothetical protein AAAC47_29495, partial [Pararhizobium sp.]